MSIFEICQFRNRKKIIYNVAIIILNFYILIYYCNYRIIIMIIKKYKIKRKINQILFFKINQIKRSIIMNY